jgi:hypothetical protein
MSETQGTLAEFGIDSPKEPLERTRQSVESLSVLGSIEQYETGTLDTDLFPDIKGYNWEALPTRYGQIEAMEWWRPSPLPTFQEDSREDPENIPGSGGIIINGAKEYLREHALTEIDLPKYYTQFEDEVGSVFRWSVDGVTHIDWGQIERAVRLSNGAGRIDTATTRLVLCDTGDFIITGPRGCFLVEGFNSSYARQEYALPEPPDEAVVEIDGLSIPEESPKMQDALRRWVRLMKLSGLSPPVAHCQLIAEDTSCGGGKVAHRFNTAADDDVEITANDLKIVDSQRESRDAVEGLHQFERPSRDDDTLYTAFIDDLPGEIGDSVTVQRDKDQWRRGETISGIISGYRSDWKVEKRVYGMSGKKRPVRVVFRVGMGLLQSDGTLDVHTREVAEFDLR